MVVTVGVTVVEPEVATVPTSGDIVTLLAFVVVQVRMAVSPASKEDLLALKELIEGGEIGSGVRPGMSDG